MVTDLFNLVGVKMSKVKQARRRNVKKSDPVFVSGQTTSSSRGRSNINLENGIDAFLKSLNAEEVLIIQNAEDEVFSLFFNKQLSRRGKWDQVIPDLNSDEDPYRYLTLSHHDCILRDWFSIRDLAKLIEFSNSVSPFGSLRPSVSAAVDPIKPDTKIKAPIRTIFAKSPPSSRVSTERILSNVQTIDLTPIPRKVISSRSNICTKSSPPAQRTSLKSKVQTIEIMPSLKKKAAYSDSERSSTCSLISSGSITTLRRSVASGSSTSSYKTTSSEYSIPKIKQTVRFTAPSLRPIVDLNHKNIFDYQLAGPLPLPSRSCFVPSKLMKRSQALKVPNERSDDSVAGKKKFVFDAGEATKAR